MAENVRIFASIATAIFIEAMPFLALGSLLSAVVEVFVSPARVARLAPKGVVSRIAVGVSAGLVLPTCECGVVPVARRLLKKGVPAPTVMAYLLSAPILNPVVLASTYVAFRGSWLMVGARAAIAVIVGAAVAFLVRRADASALIRDRADPHGLSHADEGHSHAGEGAGSRLRDVWHHAAHDFLEMGKYLVLGAFAAAAFKTLIPLEFLRVFEGNLVISISGMMLLAITLSVCSEADAFVAASFVTFPAAAHLAFITIGPMVDIKLIGLYAVTFRRRLVGLLIILPLVLVFLLCLVFGLWL
jgi:uncharacterized membrane protein YraQ (UPF0718 family)